MHILFFHGGPGFNSNPERHLFFPLLEERGIRIEGWDEPSPLRPDGYQFTMNDTYSNALKSAESFFLNQTDNSEPVCLLCHSFGANVGTYLARKYEDKIKKIIFITPGLAVQDADLKILKIGRDDYKDHDLSAYQELNEIIADYTGKFDENTIRGFQHIARNPRFFQYYWTDTEKMQEYFQYFADPGFSFDLETFFHTRKSFFTTDNGQINVPAACIFGSEDPVISADITIQQVRKMFVKSNIYHIDGTGHYPHIECADKCLDIICSECG